MQSIGEIKEMLAACPPEKLPEALSLLGGDTRKGAQNLVKQYQKKYEAYLSELERLEEILAYERECYGQGYALVAGIDEVGRGPLAGPVVAAAVILPQNHKIPGINDSKKLTAKKREELCEIIKKEAVAWAVGVVSHERIDEINILQATYEAMRQAISRLEVPPEYILADAVTIPGIEIPQKGIIKGDAKSISIGAASIVAKVTRDAMMEAMEELYPGYDFASNKGYGSQKHLAGIARQGLCPIHRRSFVKNLMQGRPEENKTAGNIGEALAVREMMRQGYEILEQNYRGSQGEIDIIAQKEGLLVFTEVKARKGREQGLPGEAIDRRKRERIVRTAEEYLAAHEITERDCRFDVAEVLEEDGKKYFRYIENAFTAE